MTTLLVLSCSDPVAPDPAAFGALYRIQEAPDPPVLTGQTLEVTLEYGGCRNSHDFEVRSRATSANSTDIWLLKTSPDEPCDMLVVERRSFQVTTSAGSVRLLGPEGAAFILRAAAASSPSR
ncbi:MAG TPA: hypothetical protein VJ817_04610 [Gemmatimonadales bacterium]|nr:hypothetical protein [Gemmatimonadales bacterium]